MKSKWCILGCVLILSALIVSGCGSATVEPTQVPTVAPTESSVGLPNPASVYCEEQGYTLEMRTDANGGQYGVCIFPDGSECEEWAFFRGECSPGGEQSIVQPLKPAQALDMALAYIRENFGDQAPAAGMTWTENQLPEEGLVGSQTIEYISEDGEWIATLSYPIVAPEAVVYEIVVTAPAFRLRWAVKVDAAGQVTGSLAPSTAEPVACLYGRVESSPAKAAIDDYLILLPEEARRALDVVGADETIEAQIEDLRDSGIYAHFWGLLDCDLPGWGGCRFVVTSLRLEGPEGPFFDPDPVEGWMGAISGLPGDAQFDDYLVKSGSVPLYYGIDSLDDAVAAQLEELRDTGAIVRVWGQVTCPAIDFYGTQVQVDQIEIVMEAPAEEEGYKGWKVYANPNFGYALRYPADCTVMGANLNQSVTFQGPLLGDEYWPVLTVSHPDSDFQRPPVGADVEQWLSDMGSAYDEVVEIAGLSMAHARQDPGPGAYASDQYYFIRDGQLFTISILHTGWQEDWELCNKFLESFTFP